MKRITTCRKIDEINFVPKISFCKDGVEFAQLNLELIQDLTFKSPMNSPFKGPEFTMDEAYNEILHCLKHDLNDSSLDQELEEVLKNLKNNNTNTK
jgi:hypothetical protein